LPRRFYLKTKPVAPHPGARVKARYPIWYIPGFSLVGALLAVFVFWMIQDDEPPAQAAADAGGRAPVVATSDTSVGVIPGGAQTNAARSPSTVAPVSLSGTRIQVLNGCGVKGLARRMSPALRALGLDVRETKNAPHPDYDYSSIIDRRGQLDIARALADSLGISRSRVSSEFNPNLTDIDVSLIVGKDYRRLNLNYQSSTESNR